MFFLCYFRNRLTPWNLPNSPHAHKSTQKG
nr:MAG TPA: hypothetical protein [Caudoviricetes sp.]